MWKKNIQAIIDLQKEGSDLFDKHPQVLYEYATGVGKSKQAIDNIAKDNEWWVIFCWETAHIENWKNEFKAWNMEHLLERVHIVCYASIRNYFANVDDDYRINIVCDEAHHMFAPVTFPFVVKHFKKLIMLTATMPTESKLVMQTHPRLQQVVTKSVPLNMAIKRNILPEPRIYVVPVACDSVSQKVQIVITKGLKRKWEKKPPIKCTYEKFRYHLSVESDCQLQVLATESQALDYYNGQVKFYEQRYLADKKDYLLNKWKQAGTIRKRFIAELKTSYAKIFIEQFGILNHRAIIFCGSVSQASELGGTLSVHSKLTKKTQRTRIEAFQNRDTDQLYTNRMLREGMNLEGIEKAVIIQLDNKNLAFTQMAGRAMRSELPELFIFNVPGTQDDKYLKNSLKGVNKKYIRPISQYGIADVDNPNILADFISLGLD